LLGNSWNVAFVEFHFQAMIPPRPTKIPPRNSPSVATKIPQRPIKSPPIANHIQLNRNFDSLEELTEYLECKSLVAPGTKLVRYWKKEVICAIVEPPIQQPEPKGKKK
jgi:hypothetical protein